MRKAGVISLYNGSYNYGGVLQAYAVQCLLREFDLAAEQILYRKERSAKDRLRLLVRKHPLHLLRRGVESVRSRMTDRDMRVRRMLAARREGFRAFKKKRIADSGTVYNAGTIADTIRLYDVFITGSDQVFGTRIVDEVYALGFVPNDKIKLSLCASMPVIAGGRHKALFQSALPSYRGISVREERAAAYLSEITRREVVCLPDPVLLIDRREWIELASGIETCAAPYVLCYYLGTERGKRTDVMRYAVSHGCRIVQIAFAGQVHIRSEMRFGDVCEAEADPARFLALIRDAHCVFTDSYHAVCFAHVFHKPFRFYHRAGFEGVDGRVSSLLAMTGVTALVTDTHSLWDQQYAAADGVIARKREEARAFLASCLKTEEN